MVAAQLALALLLGADPSVRPVEVPAALAAVTSPPELSGLAWAPTLGRFLVVSDDTGLREEGDDHAPFVLALDAEGGLDPTPVPIRGIAKLNDPEALCEGPAGTFFLATSHSPNKKGKTRPARRQLLHLKMKADERALTVLGAADLLSIEGGSLLSAAGLPADGRLDLEALGFHQGALFLGLKSPLTAQGEAVVLRLDDPVGALKEGRIRAAALHRFAALPLCVPALPALPGAAGAKPVCQGLSDMVFLPDGSLVASSNAPKGGPKDGGGSVWLVPAPIGQTAPRLLKRFEGLKPEGVTIAPGGGRIVVVFDCDQAQPLWAEVPLPAGDQSQPKGAEGPGARK